MDWNARDRRVIVGGIAAAAAAVLGFTGATASAEPAVPAPPVPAPATVTVTVTPQSAPAAIDPSAAPRAAASAPQDPAPAAAAAAPPTTPGSPLEPAASGTLADFFRDNRVTAEPLQAEGFTALNIVLPMPAGWRVVPDPNVPDAFAVIADRTGGDALYTPNAQLFVSKLVGEFDPREAISHGYVDSQKLRVWQSTGASMADFGGFPSSVIEGTYRENDLTLNTSRRHLIATTGQDRYLVSLFVTTAANQVVATATATDAIINGFRVTVPGTSPAPRASTAAQPAATPASPAPAAARDADASPAPAAAVTDAAASEAVTAEPAEAVTAEPAEAAAAEPAEAVTAEPAEAAAAEPAA